MMKLLLFVMLACAARAETWTYCIQPCTPELAAQSGCEAADSELGAWALEAWQKASGGALTIVPAKRRIRVVMAYRPAALVIGSR